MEVIWLYTLEK